jgi:hypothetical protein
MSAVPSIFGRTEADTDQRIRANALVVGNTFLVGSALLFVALLIAVEFSYRHWVRRALARHSRRAAEVHEIDVRDRAARTVDLPALEAREREAKVISLPTRDTPPGAARRSG